MARLTGRKSCVAADGIHALPNHASTGAAPRPVLCILSVLTEPAGAPGAFAQRVAFAAAGASDLPKKLSEYQSGAAGASAISRAIR